jgi:RNA polymerase sigma factor (sigma-70 family)
MARMPTKDDGASRMTSFKSFQTTRWSIIFAARDGDDAQAREALAAFCGAYWYPLYAFVRRKGYDSNTAQDLVQGFMARLLEKHDLVSVVRGKGKFRSFLMSACTHYMANQRDHERAKKRGGGRAAISIDGLSAEARYARAPADRMTAERLFERQWALTLLENVIERLETEMSEAGKARQFAALKPTLLGEATRVPYGQIAAELGLSEDAARAAAHRLRKRYRALLKDEVARTVDKPEDVDEEIAALFAALRR